VRLEAKERKATGNTGIDCEERIGGHSIHLQFLRRDYICPVEYAILYQMSRRTRAMLCVHR
jgi:hypothetical protein